MRASVLIICALVLLCVGYLYQLQQKEARAAARQQTLTKIVAIDRAIRSAQLAQTQGQRSESLSHEEQLQLIRTEQEKILAAVKQFVDLENELKRDNEGAVPQWLRDDRTWQSLDKEFSR